MSLGKSDSKSETYTSQNYIPITERFLSTEDAAKVLNTNPVIMREARSSGMLFGRPAPDFLKMGTRKIVYEAQTLIDWVKASPVQSVTTTPEPPQLREAREAGAS